MFKHVAEEKRTRRSKNLGYVLSEYYYFVFAGLRMGFVRCAALVDHVLQGEDLSRYQFLQFQISCL